MRHRLHGTVRPRAAGDAAADHELYGNVTAEDAAALVSANPVDRTGLAPRAIDLESILHAPERIVLANSGRWIRRDSSITSRRAATRRWPRRSRR